LSTRKIPLKRHVIKGLLIALLPGALWASSTAATANPTFLNRQAFPLRLGLNEFGPFNDNYLKTFEVQTRWSNVWSEPVKVEVTFTFIDKDPAEADKEEDGNDDELMSVTESLTIPKQTTNYLKTFRLTAIGGMLNKGFDHENEGSNLELVVDAQVKSVHHLDEE